MSLKTYRVYRASIVGGIYRRPGEIVEMEPSRARPDIMEEIEEAALSEEPKAGEKNAAQPAPSRKRASKGKAPKAGKPAPIKPDDGPSIEEIGIGEPVSAADKTSVDMLVDKT